MTARFGGPGPSDGGRLGQGRPAPDTPASTQGELQHLPDRSELGGPWVMWKGTPYVHLMIPISDVEYALEGSD